MFDEQVEPLALDELRIQICKPRRNGEQKFIFYGEGINAKGSNRRVVKFAPERLVFYREPFNLQGRRKKQ